MILVSLNLREELEKSMKVNLTGLRDLMINKFIIQTIQIFILQTPTFERSGDLFINKFIIQTITIQISAVWIPQSCERRLLMPV